MQQTVKIFIAGHTGMVGGALVRAARATGNFEILTAGRQELDLVDQAATNAFIGNHRPDVVLLAAAKVGGILANSTQPADFFYDNLTIATNVIHASHLADVPRLLFLGSSCIYPKFTPQPIPEKALLTGALEPTNEAYALAKIAGLKLCAAYRKQYGRLYHSAMPTNLYGPGDNYHPENSHVIPGLIHRFHEAKLSDACEVLIWGTGTPLREFLHVDDLAAACFHLLEMVNPPDWVNVGHGEDYTILQLARAVAQTVGFKGSIRTDTSKPDGTPRKLVDASLLRATGWAPKYNLTDGLKHAYEDYLKARSEGTLRTI